MQYDSRVVLGRIGRPHGVQGGLHLYSWTEKSENIFHFPQWYIADEGQVQSYTVLSWRHAAKGFLVHLTGIATREQAHCLQGYEFFVWRHQLPPISAGEYYWHDLFGKSVVNEQGEPLGVVSAVQQNGAQDILEVRSIPDNNGEVTDQRRYLIPLVREKYLLSLSEQCIVVAWSQDWTS